jgi:hypothetical protein
VPADHQMRRQLAFTPGTQALDGRYRQAQPFSEPGSGLQGVGGNGVLRGNKAGNYRFVPAGAGVRAPCFTPISSLWEHPASAGRYFRQQLSPNLKRTAMFSNLVPTVVEAVWPDHIEIELRIEIQR